MQLKARTRLRNEASSIDGEDIHGVTELVELPDRCGQIVSTVTGRQPDDVLERHHLGSSITELAQYPREMPKRRRVLTREPGPAAGQRQIGARKRRPRQRQPLGQIVSSSACDIAELKMAGLATEVLAVHVMLVALDVVGPRHLETGLLQAHSHQADTGEELRDSMDPTERRCRRTTRHHSQLRHAPRLVQSTDKLGYAVVASAAAKPNATASRQMCAAARPTECSTVDRCAATVGNHVPRIR